MIFTNKDLKRLIIPLIIEQTLAVLVGLIDVLMVSALGEEAMSGVSLVNTINILLIVTFSALATGGAVVASQYLGHRNSEACNVVANQLMLLVTVVSVAITGLAILFRQPILDLLIGKVDAKVMDHAQTYFIITALSFPFLGIYNGSAALFRAMGNSSISMKTSFLMNGINVVGNAILIYGVKMGVEGIAIPTLVSRFVAAFIMLMLLRNQDNDIHIDKYFRFGFHWDTMKKILRIGIPNGLESAMFQLGKIIVQVFISGLPTAQIAAHSIVTTVVELPCIPGQALSLAMVTVVGQCVGANDYDSAKFNIKKLMKIAYCAMLATNVFCLLFVKSIVSLFGNVSQEATALAILIICIHSFVAMTIWPASFVFPSALRAAGDVKYPMLVSIISMWVCRILFSFLFVEVLKIGLIGVWISMFIDWSVRVVFFIIRYRSEKWMLYKLTN